MVQIHPSLPKTSLAVLVIVVFWRQRIKCALQPCIRGRFTLKDGRSFHFQCVVLVLWHSDEFPMP